MHRIKIISFFLFVTLTEVHAADGFWSPYHLFSRIADMQRQGMKLTKNDLYAVNKSCLKDQVVGLSMARDKFNMIASGSLVSGNGMILTAYQPLTTLFDQLRSEGKLSAIGEFWATKRAEEVSCKNLCALQLVQMVDVTSEILAGTDTMSVAKRNNAINERGKKIVSDYTKGQQLQALITSFMGGQQFLISVYRLYSDVRLVAAPMKDFALLRVYAGSDNQPARYNMANVALKSQSFARLSATQPAVGDFCMNMGFPSRTKLYIPSFSIDYMQKFELPAEIGMLKSRTDHIQAALNAGGSQLPLQRVYEKLMTSLSEDEGVLAGIDVTHLVGMKEKEERELTAWINASQTRKTKYGELMSIQRGIYQQMVPYKKAELLFNYSLRNGSDIVSFVGKFEKLVQMFHHKNLKQSAVDQEVKRIRPFVDDFYATYNHQVQSRIFSEHLQRYVGSVDSQFVTKQMRHALVQSRGDINHYIDSALSVSIIDSKEKVSAFLDHVDSTSIKTFVSDPLYDISISYFLVYAMRIANNLQALQSMQTKYYRLYQDALVEKNGMDSTPSDANKTMRITYGKVAGTDAVGFESDAPVTDGNAGGPVFDARGRQNAVNLGRTSASAIVDYTYSSPLMRSVNMGIRQIKDVIEKADHSQYITKELKISK